MVPPEGAGTFCDHFAVVDLHKQTQTHQRRLGAAFVHFEWHVVNRTHHWGLNGGTYWEVFATFLPSINNWPKSLLIIVSGTYSASLAFGGRGRLVSLFTLNQRAISSSFVLLGHPLRVARFDKCRLDRARLRTRHLGTGFMYTRSQRAWKRLTNSGISNKFRGLPGIPVSFVFWPC